MARATLYVLASLMLERVACLSTNFAAPPSPRVTRLQNVARSAIHQGRYHEADRCYDIILSTSDPHPRTFLLKALHDVRMGRWEEARATYRAGNKMYPSDPKLLQGWGLLESRMGRMDVATRLLSRCIAVDGGHSPVQRWHIFRDSLERLNMRQRLADAHT